MIKNLRNTNYNEIQNASRMVFRIILFSIFLFSCEKNVTLKLPDIKNQIVVEGYIFQDTNAYVFLTRNTPFFSEINSGQLQQYVVKGAKVTVSDGIMTDTMKE